MNTETIAQHPATHETGIAVLRNLRSGAFHVVRYGRRGITANRYVVLSNHATEEAARKAANREWTREKLGADAPCEMICA